MTEPTNRDREKESLKQRIIGMNKNKEFIAKGALTDKDILSLVKLFDPQSDHIKAIPVFNHTESGVGGMEPAVKLTVELTQRQRVILENMLRGQAGMMPRAEPWKIEKNDTTKGGTLTVRTYGVDNPKSNVLTNPETKSKYKMLHTLLRYMAITQIYQLDPLIKPEDTGKPTVSGADFRKASALDKLTLGERVMVPSTTEIKRAVIDGLTGVDKANLVQEYNDNRNEPSRMRERWVALQSSAPQLNNADTPNRHNVKPLPDAPAQDEPHTTRKIA